MESAEKFCSDQAESRSLVEGTKFRPPHSERAACLALPSMDFHRLIPPRRLVPQLRNKAECEELFQLMG